MFGPRARVEGGGVLGVDLCGVVFLFLSCHSHQTVERLVLVLNITPSSWDSSHGPE